MVEVCVEMDPEEGDNFLAVYWVIRRNQNKALIEDGGKSPMKIIVDAARFLNEFRRFRLSLVVYLSRNQIKDLQFLATLEHAELLALKEGTTWQSLQGSFLQTLQGVNSNEEDVSINGNLVQENRDRAQTLSACHFVFVRRTSNSDTHNMARISDAMLVHEKFCIFY
ncbi:hypothetical protein Salat_1184700 [Sesamum alatum]|uniref:Uncharacterized protein n=1 Tax=Sesamum alatum TaxID=300844 RepID=A0AAE1YFX5_9LAMI|nr:hypothetical protein Salat_1184700 [Sesamum alatum]